MVSFMLPLSITFFKKHKTKKVIGPYLSRRAGGPLLGKGVRSEF